MARNTLDHIWGRLVDRYSGDGDGNCGCGEVEEAQSDVAESDTDGCCA